MALPLSGSPYFTKRIAHVCYHLIRDTMPQSAPSFPALHDHLRELADLGYNGVLLEAEAMFPYASAPEIATAFTWTPEQVAQLAALTEKLGLEVIPLLQCLGHNYFILTHPRYADLRELPGAFQQYCPTNPRTRDQFLRMAADLMAAFPGARRLHIGGDECRMLGQCPRCKAVVDAHGVSELYCRHVAAVAEAVLERGITPLLWSDIFETHPEALDRFPRGAQLVYWQYDMAHAKRPPSWDLLRSKGHSILGASGIRFGGHVNDLVPPYREALPGITDMNRGLRDHGIREMIVTDWMKGAHWELSDWGWFYGAASGHDPALTPETAAPAYAEHRFGLKDGRITEVHALLSVPLPFFETMQAYMRNRLHRLDLYSERYHQRRALWRKPENLPTARAQIAAARANARRALDILWEVKPGLRRGFRQWQLLEDAARELTTRAQAAEAALLDESTCAANAFAVVSRMETLRLALPARRARVLELYPETMPGASTTILARMRYPQVELDHLARLSSTVAGGVEADAVAARHVIPFHYNPGPPFERGLEHGRVFATVIRRATDYWCEEKNNPLYGPARDRMEKYLLDRFPELIAEMNGIAAGAGLSLDTVLWLNVFNAVTHAASSGCSTAILRRAGRIAMMKTSDIDLRQREMMILQSLDWNGRRTLRCGWAGTVWTEFGMNDAGLAVGCNSLPAPKSQPGDGLPQHLGCTPLLEACRSLGEALDFMRDHAFAGKGLNIGIADSTGAAVVERCADRFAVRPMDGDFIAATNHYVSPEFGNLNRPGPESSARKARIESFLASAGSGDVVEVLKSCAAIAEGPGRVCRSAPPAQTLTAAVIDVTDRSLWTTGRPPCDGGWARFTVASDGVIEQ